MIFKNRCRIRANYYNFTNLSLVCDVSWGSAEPAEYTKFGDLIVSTSNKLIVAMC